MAKRLTDKKKKQIIVDYIELDSYAATARKHKVSVNTVKRTILNNPKVQEKATKKREENTADMISFMDSRKDKAQSFIDLCLNALSDEEKIKNAPLQQITTAMGTVIDKFTGNTKKETDRKNNELIAVLEKAGKGLDLDAMDRAKSKAIDSNDMVDDTE